MRGTELDMARGALKIYALYLWNDDDYCIGVFTAKELAQKMGISIKTAYYEVYLSKKYKRPFKFNGQKVRVYVYRENEDID